MVALASHCSAPVVDPEKKVEKEDPPSLASLPLSALLPPTGDQQDAPDPVTATPAGENTDHGPTGEEEDAEDEHPAPLE
jgi:hypothetical protein